MNLPLFLSFFWRGIFYSTEQWYKVRVNFPELMITLAGIDSNVNLKSESAVQVYGQN